MRKIRYLADVTIEYIRNTIEHFDLDNTSVQNLTTITDNIINNKSLNIADGNFKTFDSDSITVGGKLNDGSGKTSKINNLQIETDSIYVDTKICFKQPNIVDATGKTISKDPICIDKDKFSNLKDYNPDNNIFKTLKVNRSATDKWANGWKDGIHTLDLYANGTIGAGIDGNLNAYLNSSGDLYASRNVNVGGDIVFNGKNNWIIRTSDDDSRSMYIAPSATQGKTDWDRTKQVELKSDGTLNTQNINIANTLSIDNQKSIMNNQGFKGDHISAKKSLCLGTACIDEHDLKKMLNSKQIAGFAIDGAGSTINLYDGIWDLTNNHKFDAWTNDVWDVIYINQGWEIGLFENQSYKTMPYVFSNLNSDIPVKISLSRLENKISSYYARWIGYDTGVREINTNPNISSYFASPLPIVNRR